MSMRTTQSKPATKIPARLQEQLWSLWRFEEPRVDLKGFPSVDADVNLGDDVKGSVRSVS